MIYQSSFVDHLDLERVSLRRNWSISAIVGGVSQTRKFGRLNRQLQFVTWFGGCGRSHHGGVGKGRSRRENGASERKGRLFNNHLSPTQIVVDSWVRQGYSTG